MAVLDGRSGEDLVVIGSFSWKGQWPLVRNTKKQKVLEAQCPGTALSVTNSSLEGSRPCGGHTERANPTRDMSGDTVSLKLILP